MIKWIVITLLAGFIMLLILAGIGHLLQSNQEENRRYIEQVKQAEQEQLKKEAKNSGPKVVLETILPLEETKSFRTLTQHLTCIDVSQCTRTVLKFSNLSCVVAVNKIGRATLRKVKDTAVVESCEDIEASRPLVCLNNTCQFSAGNKS